MGDFARDYIAFAAQLYSNGCFSKAFDLYILAFEKNPELKALFEPEFRAALNRLNEVLAHAGRIQDVFNNFGRAINLFPDNIHLVNDTGKYLYKFGHYAEAWCQFQKALTMDSGFVNAERNLNSIKNFLVERWHYRMLNDKVRNEAYHAALRDTVIPFKDTVLDLGSGTGLLTLYSMECHPAAMTACDSSEQMVKMAECILKDNKMNEVVIVNAMSTDIDCSVIGCKKSLLVTEMFDAGLFGEHILNSLYHAHDNLISSDGRIIPNKAEFFVIGAKCDHLNMKYQLCSSSKALLNIPTLDIHIMSEGEYEYDCEDVYQFKNLKYMTEPQSLLKIDFNDPNDVQEKLMNYEPYSVKLKAIENGEVNVVIGWFNLYLTDTITITTDPRSEQRANAWQQAVFFDFLPQIVESNHSIDIDFLLQEDQLKLAPSNLSNVMRTSPEVIRFLNDSIYVNMITKCLGMASVYLGQMAEMSEISIVDLCPFPLFGLLMLKRGAKLVTCWAKTEVDDKFFKKIFCANGISLSKVNILIGEDWSQDTFVDEKYHAVFSYIFHSCGDIDLRMYEITQNLKNAHLLQGGLFMPANVSLIGQVVNSQWLDINNRVYDSNVSDYKISMYINKYQVSQNFCLDFTCLEYTALTDPVVLGKYGNVVSGVENVPIIENGDANAILCWYSIQLMEGLGEISTNRGNSFIDGIAFVANPPVQMRCGEIANVLRCIDVDGAFKLMIDVDTT